MTDAAIADLIHQARAPIGAAYQPPVKNLGQLLARNATQFEAREALVYFDDDKGLERRQTWGALHEVVAQSAGLLQKLGVRYGDRVAFLMGNLDHTIELYLAAWTLGASVAPINASEDFDRKVFIAENSGASVLFARGCYAEEARKLAQGRDLQLIFVPDDADELHALRQQDDRAQLLPELLSPDTRVEPASADFSADGCESLLIYTSGTTGAPKGVRVDQFNQLCDAAGMIAAHDFPADLRAMGVLPIHHVNGIVVTLGMALYQGGTLVLNSRFNSRTFWKRAAEERVHVVSVVPTLLEFLISADARGQSQPPYGALDTSSLRTIICGAGPLLVETAMAFEKTFDVVLTHGYGLSETTCYNCHMPPDLDRETRHGWYHDHGFPSIGVPLPWQDMAILDANGDPLPPGERGEIAVRGECISLGYDRRPDANLSSFKRGWFHSGDEGFFLFDDQGRRFFFITGRLKELIIRGGVNYSPLEIDEAINAHPCVAAGLALPFANRFYGEEIAAYVVPHEGESIDSDELIAFCRERLEFAKSPKVILIGDELPYTTTGKPRRIELARRLAPTLEAYRDAQFQKG